MVGGIAKRDSKEHRIRRLVIRFHQRGSDSKRDWFVTNGNSTTIDYAEKIGTDAEQIDYFPEIIPEKISGKRRFVSVGHNEKQGESGYTVNEISQETGISRWALYKRFQRMKNSESTQENNSEEDTIQKNIISNTNEFQTRTNKWSDTILAILFLTSIFVVFFLYRKYNSEKIRKSTE